MTATQKGALTRVTVTDETRKRLLDEAAAWADELGSLRGSIEDGDGNTAGRYGELLFREVFGGSIADHYEYDLAYRGLHIDVKTKRRTVDCQPHYEASVSDWNTEQSCDAYYFVSVQTGGSVEPYSRASLCGYLPPDEFYDRAGFFEEGEVNPSNGFERPCDCYELPYHQLNQIDTAPDEVTL